MSQPKRRASRSSRTDPDAREIRILRAARDVLERYTIDGKPGKEGLRLFRIRGGTRQYTVTVHPEWRQPPTCTCPDAKHLAREKNRGYCKHIIAVLMRDESLRCQLLEMFL